MGDLQGMVLVVCALVICALSIYGFRQAFAAGAPVVFRGFDGVGAVTGFAISIGAAVLFGPGNGLSVVLALLLYEVGHWAALRHLGNQWPVYRLFPLVSGAPAPVFEADEGRIFHALMAPGLAVPPMVLSLSLVMALRDVAPGAASFCFALTLSLCVLGTINLLPFRGLAGGLVAEAAARVLSPSIMPLSVACAVAGLALIGWMTGLTWAYPVAALGVLGLMLPGEPPRTRPMRQRTAGLAVTAWVAIVACNLAGASLMIFGSL